MKASRMRLLMNLWPPYLCTGIRVREISPDYRHVRVELRRRWYNRNYVGTHFGGSLFAMTDPFYMLMYLHGLGRDYRVWDQAASIRFLKPGRGTVQALFRLDDTDLDRARAATAGGERYLVDHATEITDGDGGCVAWVERTVYIRRKRRRTA